jgi:hypothetical protein
MDAVTSILATISKLMFIYAISIWVETFMHSKSMAKGWGDILCAEINSWTLITLTLIRPIAYLLYFTAMYKSERLKKKRARLHKVSDCPAHRPRFQNSKKCRRFGKPGVSILRLKHHWRYVVPWEAKPYGREALCAQRVWLHHNFKTESYVVTPCSLVENRQHFR